MYQGHVYHWKKMVEEANKKNKQKKTLSIIH